MDVNRLHRNKLRCQFCPNLTLENMDKTQNYGDFCPSVVMRNSHKISHCFFNHFRHTGNTLLINDNNIYYCMLVADIVNVAGLRWGFRGSRDTKNKKCQLLDFVHCIPSRRQVSLSPY